MPGEDVTIALSGLPIETIFQVGDWVNYDASSNNDITVSSTLTGTSDKTVSPASYTGGWRVLTNNGSTVTIIAADNVASGVTLNSYYAYTGIVSICNNINTAYLNTDYASSVANPSNTTLLSNVGLASPSAYTGTTQYDSSDGSYKVNTTCNDSYWIAGGATTYSFAFRPVITLKSGVYISGGQGTSEAPYTLSLE